MIKWSRLVAAVVFLNFFSIAKAQVNAVEFGKNRVQYQKFNWRYYQTDNFNSYFSQDGLELGKYVAQVAEKELPQLEEFVEYGLQRRANIAIYNNFDEMYQSNIGLGIDWQQTGGVTKLVNNKMLVYFDGNHENLRRQIRQGIAGILVQNILFGDDLGEFAANQTLLDLPKWLTDGYIEYAAEEWSPKLDNELKNALLGGDYKNFYHFAFKQPMLAGHSFWYYIGNKYGRQKTTYMLYLARIYRNLNSATQKIAKKKFKDILSDFMNEMPNMYLKDIRARKVAPKGQVTVSEEVGKKDFIRFNANPIPKSFTYAVVEFKQGIYSVVLHENFIDRKVLVRFGARTREDEINPNYPILAWDGKGTRLAVLYSQEGKIKFFIYDLVNRIKRDKLELNQFDQVQDMKFMLDANTLILSAVKGGQTDLFTFKIDKERVEQITNDVYDDLDPQFVAFPGKTGIIFSSNRPSANAANTDTAITQRPYNIFLIDNWNQSEFKQISQLTNLSFGNARYPSQYQTTHFTFVSDENGIANRYAGFFRSERAGLDTLVFIGGTDTTKKQNDFFNSEFGNESKDSSRLGQTVPANELAVESVLAKAKLFEYRPRKFFNDYVVAGVNNTVFGLTRYQPFTGSGPIDPANGNDISGMIRMGTVDLFEDIKISGGFRFAPNFKDNDVLFEYSNLRRRLDWGFSYYRSTQQGVVSTPVGDLQIGKQHSSYYLARLRYPLDRTRSFRLTVGPRFDRFVYNNFNIATLKEPDEKQTFGQFSLEYVHDNTVNPAQNIWYGLRWKAYVDWFTKLNDIKNTEGKYLFNVGFDARHYLPIYRNVIWAVRAAGDFSWGNQKVVYYLGGVDGWLKLGDNEKIDDKTGQVRYRYFNPHNPVDPDATYAYQALAVNMRGFVQNIANGNNNLVINSEVRFPVFSTLLNRPINNALLRNFQLVQFVDLGTAWNGAYDKLERPSIVYTSSTYPGVQVRQKAGGIGPFAGGYGFGVRSTLLGYFVKFDVAWQMDGLFRGRPQTYLALGLDF
ncbi:MAG: hypothetical protein EON98_01255 [Chitinophagaceae bacterium]|nr:MAG: hypothetical protein EON98_01255 [Chitinophagaceae bacterium]